MDVSRLVNTFGGESPASAYHNANALCAGPSAGIYSTPTTTGPGCVAAGRGRQLQPAVGVPTVAIDPRIKIELENDSLWRKFHQHTTEMIVTKGGRRMFPTLRYRLSGLDPNATYAVFLELAPADDHRYKFQSGRWIVAGRAEPGPAGVSAASSAERGAHQSFIESLLAAGAVGASRSRLYGHPDSPAPGRIWSRQPLSFHRVKLTNNAAEPQTNLLLNSMHKYEPRVYVLRLHDYYPSVPQVVAAAAFPQTQFIAVTAYQNERVIQLKIDHNPFAKGFRDGASNQTGAADRRHLPASFHHQPQQQQQQLAQMRVGAEKRRSDAFLPYESDESFVAEPPSKRPPTSPQREVSPLDVSALERQQHQPAPAPLMHALHAFGAFNAAATAGLLQPAVPRLSLDDRQISPVKSAPAEPEKLSRSAEKSRKLAAFSALALAAKDDRPSSSASSDDKWSVGRPLEPAVGGSASALHWSLAAQFWLAAATAAHRGRSTAGVPGWPAAHPLPQIAVPASHPPAPVNLSAGGTA